MTNEFRKINGKNETRYVLEDASAGSTSAAMVAAVETSLGVLQRRVDRRKKSSKRAYMENQDFNGEYDDEAGMAESNLHTLARAVQGLIDTIKKDDNLPEWCQEKIAKAEMMLVSVWDYLLSQKEQGIDPEQGVAEDELAARAARRGAAYTRMPRKGQTNFGEIPVGNWPHNDYEPSKYTDQHRKSEQDYLKHRIQVSRGKHPEPNLPEEHNDIDRMLSNIEKEIYQQGLKGKDALHHLRVKLLDLALDRVGRGKRKGYEPHVLNVMNYDDAKEFLTTAFRDAIEQGVAEDSNSNLSYQGNCTQDDVIEYIFGDVNNFARMVEEHGDEFTVGDLVVKYDPEEDIHSFYYKKQGVAEGGKKKGADGKACWTGYRYAGTKNGKDNCVKVGENDEYLSRLSEKLDISLDEKSKSQKQAAIMAAAAHNPEFAKRVGISQRVAKEFNRADTGKDIKRLPVRVPKKQSKNKK